MTTSGADGPTYLAGLRLRGRRVVVLGGGRVARRRLPALVEAGAEVRVIAPEVVGVLIGVLASRNPRRAAAVRDLVVDLLGRIARRAA